MDSKTVFARKYKKVINTKVKKSKAVKLSTMSCYKSNVIEYFFVTCKKLVFVLTA